MLCGVLGGVGIVWVTVSERHEEDGEEEEEEDRNALSTRDSTDPDDVNANNISTCCLEEGTIDVNCVADNDIVPRLSYNLDDDGDGGVSERGASVQKRPVVLMIGGGAGLGVPGQVNK